MTPTTERIERAARAMFFSQHSIMHDHDREWAGANRDLWRDIAKDTLTAAFPELMSDPPTHWIAPVEATDGMAINAEGHTDFYLDPAIADTPQQRIREWRLAFGLMRDAYLNDTKDTT